MNAAAAVSGFVLGMGLITPIGAQNAHVLRTAVRAPRAAVLTVVAIVVVSDILLIGLGAAGAGAILDHSGWLRLGLYVAGIGLLVPLGVRAIRDGVRGTGGAYAAALDAPPGPADDCAQALDARAQVDSASAPAQAQANNASAPARVNNAPAQAQVNNAPAQAQVNNASAQGTDASGPSVGREREVDLEAPGTTRKASSVGASATKALIVPTLVVSLLNPHAIIDTVAIIGSAVSAADATDRASFTLGAMVASITWFSALAAIGAMVLRRYGSGVARGVDIFSGIVMLIVAGLLIREAIHTLQQLL